MSKGEVRLTKADRQSVPQTWSDDSERTIARHVRVRGTTHVTASDDRSLRRTAAETSWQSSVKHCGASPCSALNISTASLNWTRWRTGSVCQLPESKRCVVAPSRLRRWLRRWSDVRRRSGQLEAVESVRQQYRTWDCCSSPGVLTRTV